MVENRREKEFGKKHTYVYDNGNIVNSKWTCSAIGECRLVGIFIQRHLIKNNYLDILLFIARS